MRIDHVKLLEKANADVGKRETSDFFELIPRTDENNSSKLTKKSTTVSAHKLLSRFHDSIKFQFPERIPFSILPCILMLPEKLSDWPKPKLLCEMLSMLLADCGFLFEEVRSVSAGQYSPQELVSALDKKNQVLDTAYWTESSLISEVQQKFWEQYCSSKEKPDHIPDALKNLERVADTQQPGWFRRCVLELFRMSTQSGEVEPLSLNFIAFCQQQWGLTTEKLERTVQISRTEGELDEVSLKDALNNLLGVWNEVVHRRSAELTKLKRYSYLSEDGYQRYKTVCRLSKEIKKTLESPTFQICGSRKLAELLKENLRFWNWEYEDISNESDYCLLARLILADESSIRLKQLPQYLWHSSVQEMQLTDIASPSTCADIRRELEEQYIRYWGKRKGGEVKFSEALRESIDFILKLSLMEQFSIREEDSNEVAVVPISLAPVITFLIFYQYNFCADRVLEKIRSDILFRPIRKTGNSDNAKLAIELYQNLCRAYAKLYGDRYNQDIQAEWDAAFIVYTDCRILHIAESGIINDEESFLKLPCFIGISNCLAANKVSLAHSWLYQKTGALDSFDLENAGDEGRKAFFFFQSILLKQERVQQDSWLKNFLAFLQYPYSHSAIQDFLLDCMGSILIYIAKQKGEKRKLSDIENTLQHLLPGVKDPKVRMCAALEYTMRRILAERCKERLYNWLFEYFDWQFDVLVADRAIEKTPHGGKQR